MIKSGMLRFTGTAMLFLGLSWALHAQGDPSLQIRAGRSGMELVWQGAVVRRTTAGILAPKIVAIPFSNNRVLTWNESAARTVSAFYAVSLDGKSVARVNQFKARIGLVDTPFDPLMGPPAIAPTLTADKDNSLYIVQFISQPLQSYNDQIRELGGTVCDYYPENAYLCRLTSEQKILVQNLPYVRWVGPYEPAYRLEPFLKAHLAYGDLGRLTYNISVFDGNGQTKYRVAHQIAMVGGLVENAIPGGPLMRAQLTPAQLVFVAHLNDVLYVDRWSAPEDDMDIVRAVMGANYLETNTGFTGQGVAGEVLDGGYRSTHLDFQSAPVFMIRTNSSDTQHGSSTTGIVFGDGTANAQGRGMLPNGQGIFSTYTTLSGFGGSQNRYTYTQPLSQSPYFACFQSNSWGSAQTTLYTTESQQMDQIIFDQNLVILNSQSNTGTQSSRPEAWAKNVVSIGGIKHFNTATLSDDAWTNGGSIGPAADGRIKPDMCGWYDSIFCPTNTSDSAYTSTFGGTSAATPMTAGHFGLMFQMWHNGLFGNSALGATVFDNKPKFTTAKALMSNQATQYPFSGVAADLTRVHQGWGLPDVKKLYDNRGKLFIIDETDALQNLQSKTYRVYVPAGTPEFHATMCYSDPPGTPGVNPATKNDLTLKVTSPSSTIYYGNVGLTAGNYSTAGGSPDTVDTLEHVIVQNPASGVWLVTVSADSLTVDAKPETPAVIDADYGLVVSGVLMNSLVSSSTLLYGRVSSGVVGNLDTSNNQRLTLINNRGLFDFDQDLIQQVVTSVAPTNSLTELRFRVESSTPSGGTIQKIELYNYSTGQYQAIDSAAINGTDGVREAVVSSGAGSFVDPSTREVRAKVTWYRSNDDTAWTVGIDQERWFYTP